MQVERHQHLTREQGMYIEGRGENQGPEMAQEKQAVPDQADPVEGLHHKLIPCKRFLARK